MISQGNLETDFLEKITRNVEYVFRHPVVCEEYHIDISEFYDPERRQYNANLLLKKLDSISTTKFLKRVGLFRVDLFIPILTHIFGQATFNGSTGIASLYRLRNEQYGMKRDDALLCDRFGKVIIHELGHNFGLTHCRIPSCVMRSSTYVEDIDQKEPHLCRNCQSKLTSH